MRTIDNIILESIYYKKILIKENSNDDIKKLLPTIDQGIITNIHKKYKSLIPNLNIIDLCENANWDTDDLINYTGIIQPDYQIKIDVIPTKNVTKGLYFNEVKSNDSNYLNYELSCKGKPIPLLSEIHITTNQNWSEIISITPIIDEDYEHYVNGPQSTFIPKQIKASVLKNGIIKGVRLK